MKRKRFGFEWTGVIVFFFFFTSSACFLRFLLFYENATWNVRVCVSFWTVKILKKIPSLRPISFYSIIVKIHRIPSIKNVEKKNRDGATFLHLTWPRTILLLLLLVPPVWKFQNRYSFISCKRIRAITRIFSIFDLCRFRTGLIRYIYRKRSSRTGLGYSPYLDLPFADTDLDRGCCSVR